MIQVSDSPDPAEENDHRPAPVDDEDVVAEIDPYAVLESQEKDE